MMELKFNTYNIELPGCYLTSPGSPLMHESPILKAALKSIEMIVPHKKKSEIKGVDIGCADGGYAAEFAHAGYDSLGLELRDSNFERCQFVQKRMGLSHLRYIKDDAHQHGSFDVIFCCGLFYHLENPVHFLKNIASVNSQLLILHTHYTVDDAKNRNFLGKNILNKLSGGLLKKGASYLLSSMSIHEGYRGRWYREFSPGLDFASREKLKWASYENYRSFWLNKNDLLQVLREAGYSAIYEQHDYLEDLKSDDYRDHHTRGMFVAVMKTGQI